MASRYENDVYALAKHLGGVVASARNSLSDLAVATAEAASKGKLDEDDAQGIYEEYIRATDPDHQPTDNSIRGNVSKLRQIIKVASNDREVLDLFRRVRAMHDKLKTHTRTAPLYTAYVDAARLAHQRGAQPTDAQLEKICKWRWG
jgi:polyhydroxyalkanoate synthesis regulator phasin